MNDLPQATVVRTDQKKRQWGTNILYRVQGKKGVLRTKPIMILAACVLVVVLICSVMFDTGGNEITEKSSVKLRDDIAENKTLDVPFHNEESEAKKIAAQPQGNGGGPAKKKFSGLELIKRDPNLVIPPGAMTKGHLIGATSNGLSRVELTESLRVNGEVLFPAGVILIGEGNSTEERLFINFRQAVFRDGLFSKIEAQVCDPEDQLLGLSGSRIGHEGLKLAAGIGLNFASGLSQGLQDTRGQNGAEIRPPTPKNALLNGASTAALEQSKELMNDVRSKPTIMVAEAGKEVCIVFAGGQ